MKAPLPTVETIDAAAERLVRDEIVFSCNAIKVAWCNDRLFRGLSTYGSRRRSGSEAAKKLGARSWRVDRDDRLGHRLTWLALLRHFAEQGIDPLGD